MRSLIVALLLLVLHTNAEANDKVALQLRWDHQFQFAGYYAALWQGYYRDSGIDVDIRSAILTSKKRLNSIEEVAAGRADFGIGSVDALVARENGAPLVFLANIFQQSAVGIVSRKELGVTSPADLTRLKVRRIDNDLTDVELQAILRAEGIDPTNVGGQRGPGHAFNMLKDGEIDAYSGYTLSALWRSRKLGVEITVLRPSTYGVDFYGDGLFTNEKLLKENPDLVARFKEASLKGWEYALAHPDKIIQRIITDLKRTLPVEDIFGFNRFQSEEVKKLTLFPVVKIGHINFDRWRRIHTELEKANLVSSDFDLRSFLYDPVREREEKNNFLRQVLLVGFSLFALVAIFASLWIRTLRVIVAERTNALETATQEAETANAAKSEFLAAMSHDLRTPLNAIMGFAELMERRTYGDLGDPHYDRYAKDIHDSGKHLVSLINDVLDLSKVESGKYELSNTTLDVAAHISSIAHMIRPLANDKNISLTLENENDKQRLNTDERVLTQILNNLLSNAIKFTEEGGRITLSSTLMENGDYAISVRDSGYGMSKTDIEKALRPFERANRHHARQHEGTGLGLHLCANFMKMFDGSLGIESEIGNGTVVTIVFPAERVI